MGSSQQTEPKLVRHVHDAYPDPEAIFEAGRAVEDLVAHPGWGLIADVLDREIREIDRKGDGETIPQPYPEMCFAHGRRGGLNAFRDAAQAILSVAARRADDERAKHERAAESAQRS